MITIYTKGLPLYPGYDKQGRRLSILCPMCNMVCANECELECPRCPELIPTDLNASAKVDDVRMHIDCALEVLREVAQINKRKVEKKRNE